MDIDFSTNDSQLDDHPKHLVNSPLFRCNLFRLFPDGTNALAQCVVCKSCGVVRFVKGRTTSNYHIHMKRFHPSEYEQYLNLKNSGYEKPIIPIDENFQFDEVEYMEHISKPSPLFAYGFFEIRMRLPNKAIKANCITCQNRGRSNLIHARENCSSNLLAHLRRMHPVEYEQYLSLAPPKGQLPMSSQADIETQQSVVSTIKSEDQDLEFVQVDQDDINGETWDSFESSELYDTFDNNQPTHTEFAATSTTKMNKTQLANESFESSAYNENPDATNENDALTEWDENKANQSSLLFRGGFFRFLRTDGVTVRAECLSCKQGNVYSGHRRSGSNFIKHLSRLHPKDYERYLAFKEEERVNQCQRVFTKFEQTDFNQIVLNFMIKGMHHPSLLEDPSFDTLLNDIACNRTATETSKKKYHIISPKILTATIKEQLLESNERLQSTLKELPGVSTAVDAWTIGDKTFMITAVNWINSNNFQRISNVIKCDIFNETVSNEKLVECLHKTYSEYKISDKIVATVINNHRQYEQCESYRKLSFLQFNGLQNCIKNPTHVFEMIGIEEVKKALTVKQYAEYHKIAFEKFHALSKQLKSGNLTEKATSMLNSVFNYSSIGSKVTEIYNSISALLNLNDILNELSPVQFTAIDIKFFKEYTMILEPIATAIEYLQKNNCYYATFMPMIYSIKDNLMSLVNQNKIQLCQILLTTVLNAVEHNFQYLFDFNNKLCYPALISTCTHPFFKMRWLKGDLKVHTNQILNLLVEVAKEYEDKNKITTNHHQSTSNDDTQQKPSEKKFKFSFDTTSNEDTEHETMIQMDFMSFLKKPCQNNESDLDELKLHPWVQKLFIRYNSILSSAASFEQHVPLFDIIHKSQFGHLDDELFCKMVLLRGSTG